MPAHVQLFLQYGTTAVRGTLIAGTYVARAFTADSYNKVGESAPFVVQ